MVACYYYYILKAHCADIHFVVGVLCVCCVCCIYVCIYLTTFCFVQNIYLKWTFLELVRCCFFDALENFCSFFFLLCLRRAKEIFFFFLHFIKTCMICLFFFGRQKCILLQQVKLVLCTTTQSCA